MEVPKTTVNRTILLASIFTLMVSAEAWGQSPNQDSSTGELQKLQNQLEDMRSQMAKMQNRISELEASKGNAATSGSIQPPAQALRSEPAKAKNAEEPMSFHYKGLTLTPGGFLESAFLVRTRNENADLPQCSCDALLVGQDLSFELTAAGATSR